MDSKALRENFWHNLVNLALCSEEEEADCGDCEEFLDQYVDLLEAGVDPTELLPEIEQHLSMCPCCRTEMEALLVAIKTAQGQQIL